MSRGFNEHEKLAITNSLIEQGKILFSTFGFKKTTISEITKNVGIAQGTFYHFFNSKEELYFIILEKEEEKIKEQFLKVVDTFQYKNAKKVIKNMLIEMLQMIETNPLIRELYFGSTMQQIINKLSPALLEKHFKKDTTSFLPLIHNLKEAGLVINRSPEVLAGVLRSLFILTLHQKEIGENVYRETIEIYVDLIVDGLIKEEGK